jgi:ligand-binding SRPBCC domain-containing protein
MKLFRLDETQCLPISIVAAWSFFSDPNNLTKITPVSLGLEVSSAPNDRMYAGMIITHRVRPLLGIPINWVTEITHVDEPRLFVDEQRLGPYRFWHHQHHFKEVNGGVEIRDIVHYSPFVEPMGTLLNELIVKRQLKQIFDYRRRVLEETFGAIPSEDGR